MTVSPLQGVTHACIGLSYLCAFVLELAWLFRPRPAWRIAALAFGGAGIVAHSLYLAIHHPTPAVPYASLLWLALCLAIFYFYGTIHHAGQAWAVFVLPVVIGLVGLSRALLQSGESSPSFEVPAWVSGERFWGAIHGILILGAAVGVAVGFVGSIMYLIRARRLRKKMNPDQLVPMLSLDRLERMNRRALNFAFPLLSVGLLVGTLLMSHDRDTSDNWLSWKVLSTVGLWLVFIVQLYVRYAVHVPPRRLAILSIVAFGFMLVALGAAHPFAEGGVR